MKTEEKRDKAIDAISKDPYRIIKGNPIINAKFDISAVQMKIFLHMIASIDQAKDSIPIIKITVKDFQKLTGINSNNIYAYVEKEAMKMREKRIFFSNNKITFDANLISAFVYYKDEGYFTLEIPQALHPFLLQIKENFTVLDIRNILQLDSIYAMRFYEFCKEYERFGKFKFEVEELKNILGLSNRYKNYFDFKKKVIEQARKELEQNAEIYFEFKELKNGKKVEVIEFTILKNSSSLVDMVLSENSIASTWVEPLYLEDNTPKPSTRIFNLIKAYDVTLPTVEKWLSEFSIEQVSFAVDYVLNELKANKNIANVGGYLNQMVRSQEFFEQSQKEAQKKEEKKKKVAQAKLLKDEQQNLEQQRDSLRVAYYEARRVEALKILRKHETLYLAILDKLKVSMLGSMNYRSYLAYCQDSPSFSSFETYFMEDASFFAGVLTIMLAEFPEIEMVKLQFTDRAKQLGINLI